MRAFRSSSETTMANRPSPFYAVVTVGGERATSGDKVYGDHTAALDPAASLNLISRSIAAGRSVKVHLYPETRQCVDTDGSKYQSVGSASFKVYISGICKHINAEVIDSQFIITRDGKLVHLQIGKHLSMWDAEFEVVGNALQRGTVSKASFGLPRYYIRVPDGTEGDKFFMRVDGEEVRCTKSLGPLGRLLAHRKGEKVCKKDTKKQQKENAKPKTDEVEDVHQPISIDGVLYH